MRIRAIAWLSLSLTACYVGVPEGSGDATSLDDDVGETLGEGESSSSSSSGESGPGEDESSSESGPGEDESSSESGPGESTEDESTDSSDSEEEGSTSEDTGPQPMTVCERWNADRADMSEGSWSGSLNGCNAGDMDASWRERSLTLINLYRFLAELPPVTTSAERDAMAQSCALMMDANGALSHNPPMGWTCYSADGAQGAGSSNIAGTAAVAAVDLYMVDPGNETTIGHRRWILSNSLGPTGIGSTDGFSCMWTLGGNGNAGKAWTAFPTPGEFPFEAMNPLWWGGGLDETGWTVQSDSIALNGAQVSVSVGGQDYPVAVTNLAGGYGSTSAIKFTPQGWSAEAGTTYHVEVTGISEPIVYDVEVVDCG